jgi:hypothetical protein
MTFSDDARSAFLFTFYNFETLVFARMFPHTIKRRNALAMGYIAQVWFFSFTASFYTVELVTRTWYAARRQVWRKRDNWTSIKASISDPFTLGKCGCCERSNGLKYCKQHCCGATGWIKRNGLSRISLSTVYSAAHRISRRLLRDRWWLYRVMLLWRTQSYRGSWTRLIVEIRCNWET